MPGTVAREIWQLFIQLQEKRGLFFCYFVRIYKTLAVLESPRIWVLYGIPSPLPKYNFKKNSSNFDRTLIGQFMKSEKNSKASRKFDKQIIGFVLEMSKCRQHFQTLLWIQVCFKSRSIHHEHNWPFYQRQTRYFKRICDICQCQSDAPDKPSTRKCRFFKLQKF